MTGAKDFRLRPCLLLLLSPLPLCFLHFPLLVDQAEHGLILALVVRFALLRQ